MYTSANGQLDMFPETELLPMKEVPAFLSKTLGGEPVSLDQSIELAKQGTPGFRQIKARWYLDRTEFCAGSTQQPATTRLATTVVDDRPNLGKR